MRLKVWKYWLGAAGVAVVLYYTLVPRIPHATQVTYFLMTAASVVCVLVGVRIHKPERPAGWYLLAAGQLSFAVADGIWNGLEIVKGTVPYPSLADPFYVVAYPLFAIGLFVLIKRSGHSGRGGMLDAAIVTLGAAMMSWAFLLKPYLTDPAATSFAKLVSAAYPVGDLFLVGMVVPLAWGMARRTPCRRMLLGWVSLLLAADSIYSISVLHGWYVAGSWMDAGFMISYTMLGAAALHPSMAQGGAEAEQTDRTGSLVRSPLTLLTLAAFAGPAVLIYESLTGVRDNVLVIASGCLVLAALVLKRLSGLVRESDARGAELTSAADQLFHQAFHDPLTGLANRALFADRLQHAMARSKREGSCVALLLLDLDDFKAVNDGMGHAAGDELLVGVADRLQKITRGSDTLARLGGDEFALILEFAGDRANVFRVTERNLAALRVPFTVGEQQVFATASIGIALNAGEVTDGEMLRHADVAMYMAKRAGKGRAAMFEPEMGEAAVARMELESALRSALEGDEDQFVVYYQPIVDMATNRVRAVEALVRWNHPTRGLILPGDFLPVAEETGLIVQLGRWVLGESCRQAAIWRRSIPGHEDLTVNVNLSTKELEDPDLLFHVESALAGSGLVPEALTLELTENLFLRDVDAVGDVLHALERLGVRLAVDDFGAGNSSMSYLKRFPITELKIDKSYVDALAVGACDPSLVQGLIDLGRAVHLKIVAEGIEQPIQASMLMEMGCDAGQGYLFARPQPAGSIEVALRLPPALPDAGMALSVAGRSGP